MVERLRRRALKENRVDDASDEVIGRRFEVYQKETEPVLEYYATDKVVTIDAAQSQIRVLSEIIRVLVPLKESLDVHHEKAANGETDMAELAAATGAVSG
jgi:adenylate kinase